MELRTLKLPAPPAVSDNVGFFRYGLVGGRMLLTNDAGEWHFLSEADFQSLLAGQIEPSHADHAALRDKGFIREGFEIDAFAERLRRKKSFVGQGPHLHIVLTTLRCNQSCRYCHASRTSMDRVDTDMSMETAKQVVDFAFQSTSPYLNFEFQGGEPTVNFPVLKYVVEYSREKNRTHKKLLEHSLVTNMTYMTEENANWLTENNVLVCTSLDGTEETHNWNRTWTSGNAQKDVVRWIHYFNERYKQLGRDPRMWHVDALMTTTRKTFDTWKELIDLYLSLGIRNLHLRPLNPYGFALPSWKNIGYSMQEYLAFYEEALDYIIELNRRGIEVMEATAALFLVKILTPEDPNYVDIRSPTGAGTGVLAYNYDGRIFPADEARMLDAMGNGMFQIGKVGESSYEEVVRHPTVRSLSLASIQDSLPACHTCWNKPYCGVDPLDNYMVHGDIFGQRPLSPNCKEYYTVASLLFDRLANDPTGEIERIFRRWTLSRPRNYDSNGKEAS
jgi:uncharacterized protein